MADTENTIFDPVELLRIAPIDDVLRNTASGGEQSVDDVVALIMTKFGAGDDYQAQLKTGVESEIDKDYTQTASREFAVDPRGIGRRPRDRKSTLELMARVIAEALPRELRNSGFVNAADLRPWMNALRGKTVSVDGFTFTLTEEAVQQFVDAATYDLRVKAETISLGGDVDTRLAAIDASLTYDPKRLTPVSTPDLSKTSGDDYLNDPLNADVGEDEILELFRRSNSDDILDLQTLLLEQGLGEQGTDLQFSIMGPPAPNAQGTTALPFQTGNRMNYRAAADYLYEGKVTPSQMIELQRKMVRAGLFDAMPDGYEAGDVLDKNSNLAWRALLAESYRRQTPVPAALDMLINERKQRRPDLQTGLNKRIFNVASQQLIGRSLTDEEQAGLMSYLRSLSEQQGYAQLGADPMQGYSEAAVGEYVTTRFEEEVEGIGSVRGTNALFGALGDMT